MIKDQELAKVLREITGTRARVFEFSATHSRLHLRFDPQDRDSSLPRYDILFIGTERMEASVHFTVLAPEMSTHEAGIDGSHITFESNGGEILISSSDTLIIYQDDKALLDLDTLTNA